MQANKIQDWDTSLQIYTTSWKNVTNSSIDLHVGVKWLSAVTKLKLLTKNEIFEKEFQLG